MAFWWVNHSQTFRHEIEGGYIWSPKTNQNGAINQTYLNLPKTRPGDIVFSYASTKIAAIGIFSSPYREQGKPSDFGVAGEGWANNGWAVSVDWQLLSSPLSPSQHMDVIGPQLPERHSPIRANGHGNQGCYLAEIGEDLGETLLGLARVDNDTAFISIADSLEESEEKAATDNLLNGHVEPTEFEQLVKARRGQGKFRRGVEALEDKCRVTGVQTKHLLIASHIKPWAASTNAERLDGNNGLLLAPHVDKLFDRHWISFEDNGDLIWGGHDTEGALVRWGIPLIMNVGAFSREQSVFLADHRSRHYERVL